MPQPPTSRDRQGAARWSSVVAAMVGLQGLVVMAFAVFFVLEHSHAFSAFNVALSAALFAVAGAALLFVARGLLDARHWARSPALTWQLVCLPVAYGLLQSGRWYVGLPLAATALITLAGLFARPAQD